MTSPKPAGAGASPGPATQRDKACSTAASCCALQALSVKPKEEGDSFSGAFNRGSLALWRLFCCDSADYSCSQGLSSVPSSTLIWVSTASSLSRQNFSSCAP